MKILFTGGGTMGSVTPLIAIKDEFDRQGKKYEYLWIGTAKGPERLLVEKKQINYRAIASGKLRRYFDWRNFTDLFLIFFGFIQSLWFIFRFKPDIVLTAGSFVSVPVAYAAKLFKVKVIVHQQDLVIGLANKLMVPVAFKVTLAFPELKDKFPKDKSICLGNPVRPNLFDGNYDRAVSEFHLERDLPTLLIMGGGLGAEVINEAFIKHSKELTEFCQIIHLLGKGEQAKWLVTPEITNNPRYHAFEFLTDELADAYSAAHVVFSRAGLSSLTELSALGKPSVIMPIPGSQQVENAEYFFKRQAIVYVKQEDFTGEYIVELLRDLFNRPQKISELSHNISKVMPVKATAAYCHWVEDVGGNYPEKD